MGLDFTPIMILAFGALGALLAIPIMAAMGIAGIWFPGVLPWIWAPPMVGLVLGLICGGTLK